RGRPDAGPRGRRPDQHRLRRLARRSHRPTHDAVCLLVRTHGRRYRQRLRRGLCHRPAPAMSPAEDGSTVAWFHCFAGIAGDMALGSLLDAGADLDEVRGLLRRLELPDWELEVDEALRGGVACTRVQVRGDDRVA